MVNDTNTIDLDLAQKWAANWRKENTLKGFLIPKEDITQLLEDHPDKVANIRGYLGIDEEGEPKLMIVGVDDDGCDLINAKEHHYIYDFTKPCPNTCDQKSPLFKLP